MKNIVIKILFLMFTLNSVFALHGKIVFYDGTYVVGKVTKVDEASVYIVPIGLDTPEGVLVGNIDSLRMENGMTPVINSAVKYFYQNGEFLANDSDWMDEYDDFQYDDYASIQEEYKYEKTRKKNSEFWSATAFGAYPALKVGSLDDSAKVTKLNFNLGIGLQAPYYPIGALDFSPGFSFMTFGFSDHPSFGNISAIQASANLITDFKPVFFFLPEPVHFCIETGISFNAGTKVEPKSDQYEGEPTYGGIGFNLGTSIDYYFPELPIALKAFAVNKIVPQGIPYPELKTGFVTFGVKLIIVLKRHHQ
tara:strand:+ start:3350 stop:4270 length:921 start_codon:yes stop_codon:yes gene_type:complete